MEDNSNKMTRRRFLQVGGSLALGTAFMVVVGRSLWKMLTNPGELFYDAPSKAGGAIAPKGSSTFVSPYRRTFAFEAPDNILAVEMLDDNIAVAMPNNVCLYGLDGSLNVSFPVRSSLRDMAAYDHRLYLLFPARIEVYDAQGEMERQWQACSDDADYCQLTVFDGGVFVTDASAKLICHYHLDGTLARFIKSPNGFVVPSYSFAITHMDGSVYCSNPGRHLVEKYTADGNYVAAFGKAGMGDGEFSGCCNPVQVVPTPTGELLTSEKGVPRISCYTADGQFRATLLDSQALGGGHDAYDVRVAGDRLVVAGGRRIAVFQVDERRVARTLCGSCTLDCALKVNG